MNLSVKFIKLYGRNSAYGDGRMACIRLIFLSITKVRILKHISEGRPPNGRLWGNKTLLWRAGKAMRPTSASDHPPRALPDGQHGEGCAVVRAREGRGGPSTRTTHLHVRGDPLKQRWSQKAELKRQHRSPCSPGRTAHCIRSAWGSKDRTATPGRLQLRSRDLIRFPGLAKHTGEQMQMG